MAIGYETGGFNLQPIQAAPTDFSALANIKPIQFGATGQSPLVFQPTQAWQVPSAKQELVAQGIAEGVSNAGKMITATYLEDIKAKREQNLQNRKLAAEASLNNLKWQQDLKMQLIKGQSDLERAQIMHPSKGIGGATDSDIDSLTRAAEEARSEGGEAGERAAKQIEDRIALLSRSESVLPSSRVTAKDLILTELERASGKSKPKLEPFLPVAPKQAETTTTTQAIQMAPVEPPLPSEVTSSSADELIKRVPLSDIAPFVITPLGVTSTPSVAKDTSGLGFLSVPSAVQSLQSQVVSESKEAATDRTYKTPSLTRTIASGIKPAADGSVALTPQAQAFKLQQVNQNADNAVKEYDEVVSATTGPGEETVNAIFNASQKKADAGKRYSTGTPIQKGFFTDRTAALTEASRNYKNYGAGEVTEDPKSGGYFVERKPISEKSIMDQKKQIQRGLADLQVQFNKSLVVKPIAIAQPALIAFTEAYKAAQQGGPAAKIADIDLIDQYIKVTKGGLVTESQYHQIAGGDGRGFEGWLQGAVNKALGGKLTQIERDTMRDTLFGAANVQAADANKYVDNLRATLLRDYPGIDESNLPQRFPMYRTKQAAEEKMSEIASEIRNVASLGNAAKPEDRESFQKQITTLAKELEKAKKEAEEAKKEPLPLRYGQSKYPSGWPPYFGRGMIGGLETETE
jgi:hypothetical protein